MAPHARITAVILLPLSLPYFGAALLKSPSLVVGIQRRSNSCTQQHPLGMAPSSDWRDETNDPNKWRSSDEALNSESSSTDWQDVLDSKTDGSFWSSFEPSDEDSVNGESDQTELAMTTGNDLEDDAEVWLNTLASLSAEEVEYNIKEADRADKV
jgi:hypothetical protein